MHGDTIAALSTPPGFSGLAVIRLSGPACAGLTASHLGRAGCAPRRMTHAVFRDPASGEILDRLNFVYLPGPATSTGEDVLEIYPHGNPLLIGRILECLFAAPGVRPAGPGEFTRRALENNKVDVLQAEAVGEIIHAQTLEALRNAQKMASGDLAPRLKSLRDALVDLSVRLELDVDFSEEEVDPDYASWLPRVEGMLESLDALLRGFARGRERARTPRVVLMGAPNAGKSSLVNALVEEDRLLVSDIPGTTRDYVEVPLRLPRGIIHLVDTAGLGRPVDDLDERAMERTRAQGARADLRVWIEDGTAPGSGAPAEAALRVRTRKDLPGFALPEGALAVSNKTREGLHELILRLDEEVFAARGGEDEAVLATERQLRAAQAAREKVAAARDNLAGAPAIEIIAFEIREAARHMQELLGEISSEEILQRVFAGFCIGK